MASAHERMQKLVWRAQYSAFHYLQMLKELLPPGPIWRFPLFDLNAIGPDWVYLDTWFEDDFESGVLNYLGATSQYYSYAAIYPSDYGTKIMYSNNPAQELFDHFNPINIIGDFEFEWEWKLRASGWPTGTGAYNQVYLKKTGSDLIRVTWQETIGGQLSIYVTGGSSDSTYKVWAAGASVKVRVKRSSGVIKIFYDIGSGWVLSSATGTDSSEIIRVLYAVQNGSPGFEYMYYQADAGLPSESLDFTLYNVWARLLSCFASELERFEERVTALLTEMVPALSSELLEDWERVAGLPDECSALGATEEERQNTVHEKITAQYAYMNEQFYIDYAAALGVTITIDTCGGAVEEARCGIARCGVARCANLDTMFWWQVSLPTGHPMNPTIECLFQKMKPAETYLCFAYV
jgi:uncharacterized protein YmfQ (DUF2313 family)